MKNIKILTKILLLALTLAMAMGVFVIGGSAAADPIETLVKGIDFNSLNTTDTRDTIYEQTGLYFSSDSTTTVGVAVQETPNDTANKRLYFNNGAVYLRPRYERNQALMELLFTENGPETFKLEFDLAINNAFEGTADSNNTTANAVTAQRGFSVLNIGSNWLFKATAPGAGTVNVKTDENGNKVVVNASGVESASGGHYYVESVNEGTENVGYYYVDNCSYYFPASAKMGWAASNYTGSTDGAVTENGKTYIAGRAGGVASNAALGANGGGTSYTVGVPQHFVLTFTRTPVAGDNNDTMNISVDVDGERFINSRTYTTSADNYSSGIRITDLSRVGVSIDNFKVVLPTDANGCQSGAHASMYGWGNNKRIYEDAGDNAGVIYKVVCNDCGEIVNTDMYPNVVKTFDDIANLTGASIHSIRDFWSTNKNSPFWVSFDWTVDSLPSSTATSGKSVFTFLSNTTKDTPDTSVAYVQALRLYPDGTVKMFCGSYVDFDTPFQVSVGKTYRIDVRYDLAHASYDVFADGVYLGTGFNSNLNSARAELGTYPQIRFGDGNTGQQFDFANIVITQGVTPEKHNHNDSLSDEWANSDELAETALSLADGNKIVYTYKCYCGATIGTKGISEVTHDSLVPVFGNEGAVVAVENATIPTNDFTIIGKINARELPATEASLISIGEQTLVSIGEDGKLYIGENAIDGAAFAVGRDYHELALYFDVDTSTYFVYFDGENVATADYTELSGDLVFFAENGGVYNLERAVYATLAEDGEGAYKIGESDHTHYYNDASDAKLALKGHGLNATVGYICDGCYVDVTEPVKNSEYLAETLVDAYDFNVVLSSVLAEDSYWVFFDANNRAAIENGVLVKVGDVALAEYKDGEIVGYNGVKSGVKADKVGTHSIAVRVAAEDYMLYVDGKLVTTADVAELAEGLGDTLELGGLGCENVRFNELLIVNFGATDEPFTYEWTTNDLRPCYHKKHGTTDPEVAFVNGVLSTVGTCKGCGESVATPLENIMSNSHTGGVATALRDTGSFSGFQGASTYIADVATFGGSTEPFWIEFNLTLDDVPSDKDLNNGGSGRNVFNFGTNTNNFNFNSPLRQYPISNGNGGWLNDRIEIKDNNKGKTIIPELVEGETINIKLYVNKTSSLDIYVDGVKVSTRQTFMNSNADGFRFGDGTSCQFTATNLYIYRDADAEADVHVHTDKWAYMSEKGVEMTDETFEPYYYCYCGEKVSYGTVNEIVVDNIPVVYKGTTSVQAESLEGTWFATDINIRDLETGNGNLIKVGDTTVLQFKDGGIAYGSGQNATKVDHVNTYSVAVNFRADNKFDIYIDGELWGMNHSYDGGNVITLGDETFGENVRFYCNRLVKVGEGTELKPVYGVDETVRPHYHGNATTLYDMKLVVENGLVYNTAICGDCGERAKIGLNNLLEEEADTTKWKNNILLSGESLTFSNYTGIKAPVDIIGPNGIPYIVEFDLDVDSINESSIRFDNGNIRKTGRTLFGTYSDVSATVNTNAFQHFLRLFVVPDETTEDTTDYIDGKAYLRIGDNETTSPLITTIEEGHSYHFAMYVDPVKRTITVESVDLDDVSSWNVTNGTLGELKLNMTDYRFRFLDGAWGTFTASQFAFYNNDVSEDIFHTHSDAWLTSDENFGTTITLTDDHKLAYSYECYCGQTVTYGISEVIEESIAPAYGITDETVIIPELVVPENDFVFVGEISAMELPAEDGKALVTVGDKVLLSINANGEFAVDGIGIDKLLPVDNEYHSLAFRFDVSKKAYTVYFDGEYITDATYEALTGDVKIASEGAGKYHFDQAAVVVLSEDGDIAYKVAEGAHTHWYDADTSSLEFNEERTTITINYTCVECNRPASDGIVTNLYDDETTDEVESILPVFGGFSTAIITDSDILTGTMPYWISFDAALTSELTQGRGAIYQFADTEGNTIDILSLITDGTLKSASGTTVGKLSVTPTNITINVVNGEEESIYHLYVDGIYCGTYAIEFDADRTYYVSVGADFATSLEITNIKFAEMANGGNLEIGAFVCTNEEHIPTINNATYVEYINVNEFKVVSRCYRCGAVITEEIIDSYYEATPHVYTAYGDMDVVYTADISAYAYWIVSDINLRGNIGNFIGYVPLISDGGVAALLINNNGELMLADGTKVGYALSAPCTYNIALKYDNGVYYLFIDGAYKGCTTGTNFKEGIYSKNSYEYFGSPELKNIRYYNIKSIVTGVTDEPMSVEFIEDPSVLPCVHEHHAFQNVTIILDEQIKEVYICYKCGERVVVVNDKDIFEASGNSLFASDSFTVTTNKNLISSEKYLSRDAAPYWLRFTVNFESFASAEKINGANNGNGRKVGVTLIGTYSQTTSFGHLIRMFAPEDGKGGYLEGVVELRDSSSRTSNLIATVYEGETHEFAIGVIPSSGLFRVYMDGELVAQRTATTYATGRSSYGFRFLDGAWATLNISGLEFVSAGGHEHTAMYTPYIEGGYDVLAFTEATLTHRYICYCGEEIVEGIDKIYADPIANVDGATAYTAINGGEEIAMGVDPYWFSAKVFNKGTANVFSYGEEEPLVEIKGDGMFFVDGVATSLKASAIGDYDVVSVKVYPITGAYDVYVNGSYLASGNAGFAPKENFNILLGGQGSAIAYANLKLVGLANGATGEVASCGDHSFKNSSMLIKYETKSVGEDENTAVKEITKLTYICSFCGTEIVRTVTPDTLVYQTGMKTNGNRVVLRSEPQKADGSDEITYETDYFDELIDMNYNGSRWLTFEATPVDIKIGSGVNKAFVCWTYDYNHGQSTDATVYSRFFRAYGVDDSQTAVEIRLTNGGINHIPAIGNPTIEEGKTYKFAVEYFTSTGIYYAYMSDANSDTLNYIGQGKLDNMDYSVIGNTYKSDKPKDEEYGIRFGDNGVGEININNVNVFNGTTADRVVEEPVIMQNHYPKNQAPGTLSYVDGVLTHSFVCVCKDCKNNNVTINYQSFESLQNPALNKNKFVTELLDVKGNARLYVDEKFVTSGAAPYYLAFELTPDKINVSDIKSRGANGASILALVAHTEGKTDAYLHLLRAYYKDGKIVLDTTDIDTGKEFELEINEGVTYGFAFAINPTTAMVTCSVSVNGEAETVMFDGAIGVTMGRDSYYFRFTDTNGGVWGQYDFTNIKFGYMTDECAHTGKTCVEAGGKSYICDECGNETFAAHNYVSADDATGKWTLYLCVEVECGEYFVVFKDTSLISDMTFATEDLLMDYLTKTYPPAFIILGE